MLYRKNVLVGIIVSSVLFLGWLPLRADSQSKTKGNDPDASRAREAAIFTPMPEPGKKVPIGNGLNMIYGFVEKPKIGSVIMKVQVFDKSGTKDSSFVVMAESWMPSMPEMKSGNDSFKISKNGDYLTPIRFSMTGAWEIKLTITKGGKIIFRGSYKFDV